MAAGGMLPSKVLFVGGSNAAFSVRRIRSHLTCWVEQVKSWGRLRFEVEDGLRTVGGGGWDGWVSWLGWLGELGGAVGELVGTVE
jgi:hypothetical protein